MKPWIRSWILPSSTGLEALDLISIQICTKQLTSCCRATGEWSQQTACWFSKINSIAVTGEHSAIVDHVNHQCKCINQTSYYCRLCEESFENLVANSYLTDPLLVQSRGCIWVWHEHQCIVHDAECWCKANTEVNEMPWYDNCLKCENRWQYQPRLLHIILRMYLSFYIPKKELK